MNAAAKVPGPGAAAGRGLLAEPLAKTLAGKMPGYLAKMGIETAGDLLFHFPRRLDHWGEMVPFGHLAEGDYVTVYAKVEKVQVKPARTGTTLVIATLSDGHDTLTVTKFAAKRHLVQAFEHQYRPGRHGFFSGQVTRYREQLQLTHPREEFLDDLGASDEEIARQSGLPVPIYPATKDVSQPAIRKSVATLLGQLSEDDVPDPLPPGVRGQRGYPSRLTSLRQVHQPGSDEEFYRALARFRFEEAFILQTGLVRRHRELAARPATPRPPRPGGLLEALDASLPFSPTPGQLQVGAQIEADLAASHPMNRLLQGEVGSGKTLVALRAMLQVADAGGQAALLAPTEVLAAQHLRSVRQLLGPLAEEGLMATGQGPHVTVRLLTGQMGAAERKRALLDAASGAAGIVIGTHALLSDPVQFADLGLIVVDEQHRFGVEQRDKLRTKSGERPHTLVMTATPIPRTVAMTVFGDLDVSTLAELPGGRPGIVTHLVPTAKPAWVERCWSRIREEVDAGRRAFVVCPQISPTGPAAGQGKDGTGNDGQGALVAGDGTLVAADGGARDEAGDDPGAGGPAVNVEETVAMLRAHPALTGIGIGVLHGRMSQEDKDRAMADFVSGATPVLVATTVIEVGVDVPSASVMVVLDAGRFGLSQLHQLRGRVGRGAVPGLCLLLSRDAGDEQTVAGQRLAALAATSDGFKLAEEDLKIRREGDVLGAGQSGRSSLRVLRVIHDAAVIEEARTAAAQLLDQDPGLAAHPALAAEVGEMLKDREEYLDRN